MMAADDRAPGVEWTDAEWEALHDALDPYTYQGATQEELEEQILAALAPFVVAREAQARAVGRGEVLLRLDDTDGLANAMNQADGAAQGRVSPSWEALSPAGKAFYRAQVETVRAYLLGGDVDPQMVAEFRSLWAEVQAERGESS